MEPTDLINYANAIKSIESSGGNYGLVGPATRSGDRAYGAYQVMGNNVPDWTKRHYGQALSPDEFLKNKDAQDAVFKGEFGGYLQKHGNPQDAASVWFSGRPLAGNNSNDGYNSVPQYVAKFNKALGGISAVDAVNSAAGAGDGVSPALSFAPGGGALSAPAAAPAPKADDATGGVLSFPGGDAVQPQPNKLHTIGSTLANVGAAIAGISNPSQGANLRAIADGITEKGKAETENPYTYQMGGNGQLLRINKKTGKVDSTEIPGASKESYTPVMGKDDNGNPTVLGTFNKNSGEYKPSGGSTTPSAVVGGDPELTGQDRYNSLTPAERRQVDAWHEGVGIQPSQYSMRNNPKMQKLMDATTAVYPDMDFQKYGERQGFIRGYANKSPAQFGGQLVSIEHTADLVGQQADRYAKLGNSSGGIGGYGATITNYGKNLTGGNERTSTAQSLKSGAETLSGEYQTMITRGKGGGQAERADYAGNVNKPLAAPEVQAAGLQTMLDGLKARHKEIVDAALSSAGQSWLDRHPDVDKKITDTITKVQAKIDRLLPKKGDDAPAATAPAATAPAATAAVPSSWDEAQKAGWK